MLVCIEHEMIKKTATKNLVTIYESNPAIKTGASVGIKRLREMGQCKSEVKPVSIRFFGVKKDEVWAMLMEVGSFATFLAAGDKYVFWDVYHSTNAEFARTFHGMSVNGVHIIRVHGPEL